MKAVAVFTNRGRNLLLAEGGTQAWSLQPERVKKLKYGVDVLGTPVKWFGLGMRFDRLQPNSKIPEQSFAVISPRIVFKSAFLTHEEVTLQYSRYMYNQRTCAVGNGVADERD